MTDLAETDARPTVYVETSVISYLAANPSGDLITRAHQEATRRWWARGARWNLIVSSAVWIEAMKGDHATALKRMGLLAALPAVTADSRTRDLAAELLARGALPQQARVDADHVAIATVNAMDYLVTWNLKHIGNAVIRKRLEGICRSCGYEPPVICTPEALLEAPNAQ
ncbi:MAG: type II toxin-antitoxin system VapC family toxin [Longimicrobiaceae bacterium]